MGQVIKDVKLRRTNHGLYIHFELNDGTEIMRSEERLLKNLGYNPDPWDHLVLTAEIAGKVHAEHRQQRYFSLVPCTPSP